MRSPRTSSRGTQLATLAIVALGLAAAAAGIARGTSTEPIPDVQGVIHACYKNRIGLARIVSSDANCTPGETPVQWNQTGVQGPQGETGPQGPQGIQGPPGSAAGVEIYTSKFEETASAPALRLDTERGVFVELPGPATYWLTATGEVANGDIAQRTVICDLQLGADQIRRRMRIPSIGAEGLALADVRFVSGPSETAIVFCKAVEVPSNVFLNHIRIVAVKVD